MTMSFFAPSRTVLMIADDALFIYSVNARTVKMVEAVPWTAEDFEQHVAKIVSGDCGGKPVLILNDMVEQHYRKEKVPSVSILDKQNVVERKLKVAFPNYPVRAALPLKEKIAKTERSLAGTVYIFAAVPASEAFNKTLSAATHSMASIAGFCLLPVESSDMIKKLSDKVGGKKDKKTKWTVFIGQHQSGGLRQIVIKDGELALTRMTPIVETDEDPVVWADEVMQEFQATMSYLSRFGFDSDDGLSVILISDVAAGDIVSELIDTTYDFHSMTVEDAAEHLSLPIGHQSVVHYADALTVGWIARKHKFILPMRAKRIEGVSKPRQVAVAASVLFLLAALFQMYQTLSFTQSLLETSDNIHSMTQRKGQLDLQHQKEVKRKEDLGYDIQLIQSSLAIYDDLMGGDINYLSLFNNIGIALGRDMRIDSIRVKRGGVPAELQQNRFGQEPKPEPRYIADMQMTFPSTTNAERGNDEVRGLQSRLQHVLPEDVVTVTKFLEDYEYSEEIVVETGSASKVSDQDYVSEIVIEGAPVE